MEPWKDFVTNLAKLISVEAILSFVVVSLFVWQTLSGTDIGVDLYGLVMLILGYWLCDKIKYRGG